MLHWRATDRFPRLVCCHLLYSHLKQVHELVVLGLEDGDVMVEERVFFLQRVNASGDRAQVRD